MNAALSSLHPTESPVFTGLDLIVDSRPEKKATPLGEAVWFGNSRGNNNKGRRSATFSESEEL